MSDQKSTERRHIFDDGTRQEAISPVAILVIVALIILGGVLVS